MPMRCASAPEEAWKKVKGLPALDASRQRLAQTLAAWRERRAVERNRPRGWILDDVSLREIVLRLPRSLETLARCPRCRSRWCANAAKNCWRWCATRASRIRRRRCRDVNVRIPRSSRLVKRLADIAGAVAKQLEISAEVLATRRELEKLASGRQRRKPAARLARQT